MISVRQLSIRENWRGEVCVIVRTKCGIESSDFCFLCFVRHQSSMDIDCPYKSIKIDNKNVMTSITSDSYRISPYRV